MEDGEDADQKAVLRGTCGDIWKYRGKPTGKCKYDNERNKKTTCIRFMCIENSVTEPQKNI